MFKFKCKSCGHTQEENQTTIRYVPNRGVVNDIQCTDCKEYMELMNPKQGAPSFREKPL